MNETETKLEQYVELVRRYATTLDLASPALHADFQLALEKAKPFEGSLKSGWRVLDIGSGVGIPGIPIAINRPDLSITLCEIRSRRAAFLDLAVSTLGLTNVRVYNGDVRKLRQERFDAVTALAVGTIEHLYELCHHVLAPNWTLVTRKGPGVESEISALQVKISDLEVERGPLEDNAVLVVLHGRA